MILYFHVKKKIASDGPKDVRAVTLLYDPQLSPIRQTCWKGDWCLDLLSLAADALTRRARCPSKGTAAIALGASFLDAVISYDAASSTAFVATPWLLRHIASPPLANTAGDPLVLVDLDVTAMYAVQKINFNFLFDISALGVISCWVMVAIAEVEEVIKLVPNPLFVEFSLLLGILALSLTSPCVISVSPEVLLWTADIRSCSWSPPPLELGCILILVITVRCGSCSGHAPFKL